MAESLWHANVETDPGRRRMFEIVVFHALWILIRLAFGARRRDVWNEAGSVRRTMIDYMDVHGGDRPEQREYRRTHHFAPLPVDGLEKP